MPLCLWYTTADGIGIGTNAEHHEGKYESKVSFGARGALLTFRASLAE